MVSRNKFFFCLVGAVMITTLLTAVICGCICCQSVYKLDMAKAIERIGGRVWFSYDCNDQGEPLANWIPTNRDRGPRSFSERFGLGQIIYMDLSNLRGGDQVLERILVFDSIKQLRLPDWADDATLLLLHRLPNLRFVSLDGTKVTKNGFDVLLAANPLVKTNRNYESEMTPDLNNDESPF